MRKSNVFYLIGVRCYLTLSAVISGYAKQSRGRTAADAWYQIPLPSDVSFHTLSTWFRNDTSPQQLQTWLSHKGLVKPVLWYFLWDWIRTSRLPCFLPLAGGWYGSLPWIKPLKSCSKVKTKNKNHFRLWFLSLFLFFFLLLFILLYRPIIMTSAGCNSTQFFSPNLRKEFIWQVYIGSLSVTLKH